MRKILIIGSSGAGKSVFSRKLHTCTGIPLVHLDTMFWNPGWEMVDETLFRNQVTELVQRDKWIIDGNYGSTLALRASHADTIIFLDYSRWVCLWGAYKRILQQRLLGRQRADNLQGCPERMTWDFFLWIWTFPYKGRPKTLRYLEKSSFPLDKVIYCKNRRDAQQILNQLCV